MRFLTLFLFLFTSIFTVFGQKKEDTEFDKLREKTVQFAASSPDSATLYSTKLILFAKRSNSKSILAKALSTLSIIKFYQSNLDDAIRSNKQSLIINSRLNNKYELTRNYYIFGMIYNSNAKYNLAIDNYLKAIEISKKNNDYVSLEKSCQSLSILYLVQEDFETSLKYGLMALDVQKKLPNTIRAAFDYQTIANIYRGMGKYDLAELNYNKSYQLYKNPDKFEKARFLFNWSILYYLKHDYIKSLQYQLKAQKLMDEVSSTNLLSETNIGNIGLLYFTIAKNDSLFNAYKKIDGSKSKTQMLLASKNYLEKGLSIAKKNKNLGNIATNNFNLSDLHSYNGNYKEAYLSLMQAKQISDSLFSQKNKNAIAKLESQKEIDLKNKEILINKLTIQTKEKQKWYFVFGISLLAIIGGLLFYQSRNRKKTNEKLQLLNSELDKANKVKAQFFGILNHDLRSPVANLIHFLHLQKENPELLDTESRTRMENKTISGAENLLTSMEDILLWSKGQMENFKPQPKNITINSIFENTKNHFLSVQNVQFTFENLQNVKINTDENYLKTIIRNLTGNAIKALDKVENPRIVWKAWQENDKTFLSISDNGTGGTQEQFKALYDDTEVVGIKTGLGLHLIRDLARAIDCEISVDSKPNEGTTFTLFLK